MPVGTSSILEVVDERIRVALQEAHTCIPGKVVGVNFVKNTVDVEVATQAAYFNGNGGVEYDKRPIVSSVPIQWPRAGGFIVRLPIKQGDYVMLHFSEDSLAEWRSTGQLSQPKDLQRHSVGYPFAVPGAFPDSSPPSESDVFALSAGEAIIGEDGGRQLRFGALGIELAPSGVTPISPVALAVPLMAYVTAATAAGVAGAGADAASDAALSKLKAYVDALVTAIGAIPGASGVAAAVATPAGDAATAVTAAATANTASQTASTAASAAATAAGGAVPSTLVRAV